MKTHLIKNSTVETGVLEECGHLFPVRFFFGNTIIEPMHIAPWVKEELDPSVPPMLKYLRGDFFCAPFGESDILPDEKRGHGASANEKWDCINSSASSIQFKLTKQICGAVLFKEISISEGESVIYQKHTFTGGSGKLPVGHHAMLKINSRVWLSFSDFIYGGTPPQPVETDPEKGRSILKYSQQFNHLSLMKKSDSEIIDASVYPFAENHEDLYMLISEKNLPFAWSAASCPSEGWLWFSIKNRDILPNTVIWLSNGGRYYPPFSSRHKNVIGIEETASFFHLGHKASIEKNFLNEQGHNTYIELSPEKETVIPWLFGVVQIPDTFKRLKEIKEIPGGIELIDNNQNTIQTKVNMNFIRGMQ